MAQDGVAERYAVHPDRRRADHYLYGYFTRAARTQAADRIYLEAHQRIDLALVRGRCGLWDWDMVRGKMYWSRSMYDMLGYKPLRHHAVVRRGRRYHPWSARRSTSAR
ncbi:hypothetical protein [Allomesorhizobium alhagi]|uniref:hypothetical protein n=1 Tax=Allomesorhizobium alhagi TaxID=475067 RepID=UPI00030C113E|nr:hypothetical protein [Mesorhizobium alhagi]